MADDDKKDEVQKPDEEQIKKIVEQVLEQKQENAKSEAEPDEDKIRNCIIACTNASNVAIQTLGYCLEQGGKFAERTHFNIIKDCEEICSASAKAILRDSEIKKDIIKICKTVCDNCVKYCEQFKDDKQMQACKEYAQKASDACQEVS